MNELTLSSGLDITKAGQLEAMALKAKAMQEAIDSFWSLVAEQMQSRGITSVKGDWGYAMYVPQTRWSVKKNANLAPRFYKKSLDTTKLKFMLDRSEPLPKGVSYDKSSYFTKRVTK